MTGAESATEATYPHLLFELKASLKVTSIRGYDM